MPTSRTTDTASKDALYIHKAYRECESIDALFLETVQCLPKLGDTLDTPSLLAQLEKVCTALPTMHEHISAITRTMPEIQNYNHVYSSECLAVAIASINAIAKDSKLELPQKKILTLYISTITQEYLSQMRNNINPLANAIGGLSLRNKLISEQSETMRTPGHQQTTSNHLIASITFEDFSTPPGPSVIQRQLMNWLPKIDALYCPNPVFNFFKKAQNLVNSDQSVDLSEARQTKLGNCIAAFLRASLVTPPPSNELRNGPTKIAQSAPPV